ncbi:MAG: hypothetical protein MJ175_04520 [Clostridia bacterium]|nr:hypothetical protein [Clostridia bacterium]
MILLENKAFSLTVGEDAIPRSLILKSTGEELLTPDQTVSLFSVTQPRPFNNEVKLAHPNKRTTFPANRLRMEPGETPDTCRLIVGFAVTPFEAAVAVRIADTYMTFTLTDFIVHPDDYPGLAMTPPPVESFRLVSLPVKHREAFGEWLNVSRDDSASVCVLAADPHAQVDSERRENCRILYADAVRGIHLRGTTAALIAAETECFLDAVDALEKDCSLPLGVESRRSTEINSSVYWVSNLTPENVDDHIAYAKRGGFRLMLLYYTCLFREQGSYALNGNYDFRPEYPRGREDLAAMLNKIRSADIIPGLHVLQTHIGLKSRYVTPVADHRLRLTTRFTLAKPLPAGEISELFVEEDPTDTVMADRCRVLRFGGELMTYEGYTCERPYRFYGIQRGAYDTIVTEHPMGEIGGILDVSEYGASSVYLDQDSSLADEIAEKIADTYNAGFGFMYFDGSEGVNPPYAYNVPRGQYRVYEKLKNKPLFTEGAAKAHFGWHHLSGGNAFDVFAPEIFKEKIDEFPAEEAPRMQNDFTRLNFGWWGYWAPDEKSNGTQPDQFEYGTSHAAAWDCPSTIQFRLEPLRAHPRTDDILEVMRRWEDVRRNNLLTEEQRQSLRTPGKEHHLLITKSGEYALVPITPVNTPDFRIRAFTFTYGGKSCAMLWHASGRADITLPLPADRVEYLHEFSDAPLPVKADDGAVTMTVENRAYLLYDGPMEELRSALETLTD